MTSETQRIDALQQLPHGGEFRFVDCLTALDPGKSGTGQYTIRGDEPFLRGHFPEEPLFPGVLLVEAIAQLAGVVAQADPDHTPLHDLKLTAIRAAKILGTGRPTDVLHLKADITGRLANLVQAKCSASVNDQLVLQADVILSGSGLAVDPT